ncbi:tyrosine-type recombinase/integrase [Amycolatopsis sp. H20-H5]|uniref:tyrosine-type recombinase/integrase n=1 Tax=Amycolatopsis sp. H20-H5 TaxID=3046309 RepID=UPI002DB63B95|nr:tyrosine-type recombinase/integrase [Amycolatopsis sp. H20-H5]MEC3977712.1 tyrosine-type recombinase/integrase [Amycolatopsis sp. H20-H5]
MIVSISTGDDSISSSLSIMEGDRSDRGRASAGDLPRAATAAGLSHIHPHQLRHTLATLAINRGMSLEAIAALLGHHSLDMTLRYANPQELHQTGEKSQVAC